MEKALENQVKFVEKRSWKEQLEEEPFGARECKRNLTRFIE